MKFKNFIRSVAFLLIFVILFTLATRVVTVSQTNKEYQWMAGIYEEPKDSLDAVYIGSSNCYAYWSPNIAWMEYGITVFPYVCSRQPLIIAEYLIKEARKTQPDALYIININTLGDDKIEQSDMHNLIDFMPFSLNKLQLTNKLCQLADLSFEDSLEYYFPMILFHEKALELKPENFETELNNIKGDNIQSWYLRNVKSIEKDYKTTTESAKLSPELEKSLNSLLDYCDKEKVNALFVTVPRAEEELESVKKFNTINKIVSDRGYPTLDLLSNPKKANMDISIDFYNGTHANVHGAIKYTNYLSQYLIKNYNFEDKRQNEDYSSWNKSLDEYLESIRSYVLKTELDYSHRDFSIPAPEELAVEETSAGAEVSWENVDQADGYEVWKRYKKDHWEIIKDTTKTTFSDSDLEKDAKYFYTVVPYKLVDGEKMYGNHYYKGKEIVIE